jgi:hypothetical protein
MKYKLLAVIAIVLTTSVLGIATAAATVPVTFCHGTTKITRMPPGAFWHLNNHPDDIIPPFDFHDATHSLNWDEEGQAIYDNGCMTPSQTPSSTPSPTLTPSETPSTTPSHTSSSTSTPTTSVEGNSGSQTPPGAGGTHRTPPSETAVTGGPITTLVIAALTFLVLGTALVRLASRRAA